MTYKEKSELAIKILKQRSAAISWTDQRAIGYARQYGIGLLVGFSMLCLIHAPANANQQAQQRAQQQAQYEAQMRAQYQAQQQQAQQRARQQAQHDAQMRAQQQAQQQQAQQRAQQQAQHDAQMRAQQQAQQQAQQRARQQAQHDAQMRAQQQAQQQAQQRTQQLQQEAQLRTQQQAQQLVPPIGSYRSSAGEAPRTAGSTIPTNANLDRNTVIPASRAPVQSSVYQPKSFGEPGAIKQLAVDSYRYDVGLIKGTLKGTVETAKAVGTVLTDPNIGQTVGRTLRNDLEFAKQNPDQARRAILNNIQAPFIGAWDAAGKGNYEQAGMESAPIVNAARGGVVKALGTTGARSMTGAFTKEVVEDAAFQEAARRVNSSKEK